MGTLTIQFRPYNAFFHDALFLSLTMICTWELCIPQRYFFIKNVATGEFLKTGDFDPETNASPLKGEIFGVRRTGDTYFLYGVYHELYLNVFSATGRLSTSMGDGSYGVKWELEDTGIFRTFRLRNADSNKCLDTNGQSSNAEMEYCRTTDDQKWEFQELVMLKNGPYKKWLRAFDGNPGNVDLTGNQQTYERWVLVPSGDSTEAGERFYLQNYYHQSYLRAHPTNGVVTYSSTSNASVWTRTKSSTSSRYWFSTTNDSSQTLKYLKGTSSGDVTVSTSSTDAHWFRYVTGEFNGEPKTPLVYQDNFYN